MTTKLKVRSSASGGSDLHIVVGEPDDLSNQVNEAIVANEKFTTFEVPGGKKLSLIADRIEAIWQE
jgi:hypothetical protein